MKKISTTQSAFFYLRASIGLLLVSAGVFLALSGIGQYSAQAEQRKTASEQKRDNALKALVPPMFDCSQMVALGLNKQENLRAGAIAIYCGTAKGGSFLNADGTSSIAQDVLSPLLGTTDEDVITGTDTGTHITQSETFVSANPNNPNEIMVAFNDSRSSASTNYSGASISTDGGNTFTRLTKTTGQSPFANTYGDPVVLYNSNLATWFTVWIDAGCGGFGIGGYKSSTPTDPNSWTHFCVHSGTSDDRESGYADNSSTSPHNGRMYVSWNDFARTQGIYVRFSDNGSTWTEKQVTSTFIRDVQITGDPSNGNIYLAGMDEQGGGLTNRINKIYRSTDGGNSWTNTYSGPSFAAPGITSCPNSYFACMFSTPQGGYWRHMGWGQPAALNGVVHYVYDSRATGDAGDVFYIRSTDSGVTFSSPLKLNTDGTTKSQWQPNISVAADNSVLATWYDSRQSTATCSKGNSSVPCYAMWARKSTDGGVTWAPDAQLSDVVSPLPGQPDANIIAEYAGDYDYSNHVGNTHLKTWTDGRVAVSGSSQQDAFFDRDGASVGTDTVTITKAQWSTSRQQLQVTATDSDPTAVQTCKRTSDGLVFGTMRNLGGGSYSGNFRNVTTNPVNITITSDKGGTASAVVRVRP